MVKQEMDLGEMPMLRDCQKDERTEEKEKCYPYSSSYIARIDDGLRQLNEDIDARMAKLALKPQVGSENAKFMRERLSGCILQALEH